MNYQLLPPGEGRPAFVGEVAADALVQTEGASLLKGRRALAGVLATGLVPAFIARNLAAALLSVESGCGAVATGEA